MNRQITILQKLGEGTEYTIRQLAVLCETSYKMMQDELWDLNAVLEKKKCQTRITIQSGKGVALEQADRGEIDALIRELQQKEEQREQTKEYWIKKIAFQLLSEDYLKVDTLCEQMAASRTYVNKFLTEAKQRLEKKDIHVCSRPHYGLYSQGSEENIRSFLFEELVHEPEKTQNELLLIEPVDLLLLKEEIMAYIHKFEFRMSDVNLEQFLLYSTILAVRVRKGKTVEQSGVEPEHETGEYILSERIASSVANFANIEIGREEIWWIHRFLVGKCVKKTGKPEKETGELIESVIEKAIALVKEKYGFDFEKDIELYSSLAIHLKALMERVSLRNYSVNPMLDEVKSYSLLAYDMAVDISILINRMTDAVLPDDEISYIAIYFHLAIERKGRNLKYVRALVVCPTGKGMSELVTVILKKQYGEYLSAIKTCSYYELPGMPFEEYDYIFTMAPLKLEVPLPVIEFSLNESVCRAREVKLKSLGIEKNTYPLLQFSSEKLFFADVRATNKREALEEITERLGKVIKLSEDFVESVMRREKIVPTELENGFAIPHPLERGKAERSFFSVTVLMTPIVWDKRKIRIILLSYIEGDSENLGLFYDSFAQLVSNREYTAMLAEKPTYECLTDIARRISRELNL